jgi:hypothetical protein
MTTTMEDEILAFRTTFSPNAVAEGQDTLSVMSSEIPCVNQTILLKDAIEPQGVYPTLESEVSISQARNQSQEGSLTEAQATPQLSEDFGVPGSVVVSYGKTSVSSTARPFNPSTPKASPRPKSSPTRHYYPSTRTSEPRKKKRDYPPMEFYTEDGTDGINPRASSSAEDDNDDGRRLVALLEGLVPETPEKATPISTARREISPLTPNTSKEEAALAGKQKRMRELIEIDSDSGSDGSSASSKKKRKTVDQVRSRMHPRRELLSPDLAIKNKGRGRYSTSLLPRYLLVCAI